MEEISMQLKSLRLPGMAACWDSLVETRRMDGLSLHDGLELMLQAEREQRTSNRNARLLKEARFRYQASIEEVCFDPKRGLEQAKVMSLATCDYIRKGLPILITGPAGTGKSWLASALGHQACLCGFHTAYYNLNKLFEQVTIHRVEASLLRFFDKLAATDLLIIDDFGMKALDGQQLLDFLEIIEDRHGRKATIIVSQLPVADWYDVLQGNTTAADAILDRIVHTAIRFELKGESMRK